MTVQINLKIYNQQTLKSTGKSSTNKNKKGTVDIYDMYTFMKDTNKTDPEERAAAIFKPHLLAMISKHVEYANSWGRNTGNRKKVKKGKSPG